MKDNRILAASLVLAAAWIIGQSLGPSAPSARGEIPDAGAQNVEIIQLLTANNQKLDRIIDLMSSGKLKVQTVKADDSNTP
ncbi:MAG: hypothetical protein ABSH22_00360 [Tepidisphaeraceae bacterium]|jgi:hypothetical protein